MTDDGLPVLTQSMVSTFSRCAREVYYSSVLGLRPRIESIPLTRGTWVHALLEERAEGRDWKAKHQEILEEAKLEQFDEEVEDLAQQCENIMLSYDWVYKNDNLTPIVAEITVERPLFGGKALYRGRIDMVVQDENGDVWLLDHKTHALLPEWRYRELSFQNYSYLWACRKAPQYLELGLPQPKGFIYDYVKTNAIKTPTLKQNGHLSKVVKPSSTTYPVFMKFLKDIGALRRVGGKNLLAVEDTEERQYIKDFIKEVKTNTHGDLFRRDYMQFDKAQSRRQIKSFLVTAKRMLEYKWDDPDAVERNLEACSGWICNFKDLTVADLMHGSSEIEQKTRYVTTNDPLDYYPNQNKESK